MIFLFAVRRNNPVKIRQEWFSKLLFVDVSVKEPSSGQFVFTMRQIKITSNLQNDFFYLGRHCARLLLDY